MTEAVEGLVTDRVRIGGDTVVHGKLHRIRDIRDRGEAAQFCRSNSGY